MADSISWWISLFNWNTRQVAGTKRLSWGMELASFPTSQTMRSATELPTGTGDFKRFVTWAAAGFATYFRLFVRSSHNQ